MHARGELPIPTSGIERAYLTLGALNLSTLALTLTSFSRLSRWRLGPQPQPLLRNRTALLLFDDVDLQRGEDVGVEADRELGGAERLDRILQHDLPPVDFDADARERFGDIA